MTLSIHLHGSFSRPPKPVDAAAEKLFDLVKQCGADLGPQHRLEIHRRGVRRQQHRGLRCARGRHHGRARRRDPFADEFLIAESLVERARCPRSR